MKQATPTTTLQCGPHSLPLGQRTLIMGIVNVTPDSFSDGGHFFSARRAMDHALQLVAEGADILDIGGESTRPYSEPVSESQELDRVLPVIEGIAKQADVPISIDTTKASVAGQAVAAGASIINDVSALRMDPQMAQTAAACRTPLILMHMKGTPKTMQVDPVYEDLMAEIAAFLGDAMQQAMAAGVDRNRIILDPGIGFGKTIAHNLQIIRSLDRLRELNTAILIGPSRKMFLRQLLKAPGQKDMDPLCADVARGTQAAVAAGVMNGAQIVRVHDVARTRSTLKIIDAVASA